MEGRPAHTAGIQAHTRGYTRIHADTRTCMHARNAQLATAEVERRCTELEAQSAARQLKHMHAHTHAH